jgi:hypothetical protein
MDEVIWFFTWYKILPYKGVNNCAQVYGLRIDCTQRKLHTISLTSKMLSLSSTSEHIKMCNIIIQDKHYFQEKTKLNIYPQTSNLTF